MSRILMAGGGVGPGMVYGASDRTGGLPAGDPVKPDGVAAALFHLRRLGDDPLPAPLQARKDRLVRLLAP